MEIERAQRNHRLKQNGRAKTVQKNKDLQQANKKYGKSNNGRQILTHNLQRLTMDEEEVDRNHRTHLQPKPVKKSRNARRKANRNQAETMSTCKRQDHASYEQHNAHKTSDMRNALTDSDAMAMNNANTQDIIMDCRDLAQARQDLRACREMINKDKGGQQQQAKK